MKKILIPLLFISLLTACAKPEPTSKPEKPRPSQSLPPKASSSSSSSSATASSDQGPGDEEKIAKNLPANAHVAPMDKIYATGDAKVYYYSYDQGKGFEAQAPDYEGYSPEKVIAVLGPPQFETSDANEISLKTADPELENIKAIHKAGKITSEQAQAFYLTSYDVSMSAKMGTSYTLYSYHEGTVILIFHDDQLYYMTPNTDYLHFE